MYFRILAGYDDLILDKDDIFEDNENLYWGIAGLLVCFYFIFAFVRYILIYLVILISNEELHEQMIHGLVGSPSAFFDVTPAGQLTNKFSNDLGILDNSLGFCFVDLVEGIVLCLTIFVNAFSIDLFFIIPGVLCFVFLIAFFFFCKQAII